MKTPIPRKIAGARKRARSNKQALGGAQAAGRVTATLIAGAKRRGRGDAAAPRVGREALLRRTRAFVERLRRG